MPVSLFPVMNTGLGKAAAKLVLPTPGTPKSKMLFPCNLPGRKLVLGGVTVLVAGLPLVLLLAAFFAMVSPFGNCGFLGKSCRGVLPGSELSGSEVLFDAWACSVVDTVLGEVPGLCSGYLSMLVKVLVDRGA